MYAEGPLFDEVEKLLLRYAEEYLSQRGASAEVVDRLKEHYSEEQLVELDVIVGIANLVNHFIASFNIEIEKDHISEKDLEALQKRMGR
jgi:alkylhydroperoxidase family enzyme